MLERNKPQLLSIWEIAARLHEIDPETATVETLSVEAKETLRNLIIAQEHHFNIFNIDGEQLLPTYIPIVKIVKENPVAMRLARMGKDRKFDKEFLDGVYIDKEEYEYLMLMHNEPIPAFWFSANDIEYHNEQRLSAHGQPPKQKVAPPSEKPKSERHTKAAQIKHAPKNRVIEQFVSFYRNGKFDSKALAARKFIATLPPESRQLFSVERIDRTLIDALTKNLKSKTPASKSNK